MAPDPRLGRAKKILRDGIVKGQIAERTASNRSTGTRGRYKCEALAAREAFAVLDERPSKAAKK